MTDEFWIDKEIERQRYWCNRDTT